jgi:hypothetical protein
MADMKDINTSQIVETLAARLGKPGLSTRRACDADDIHECIAATETAKRRVRVYSKQGFVPNSYRHECRIQYIEARRDPVTGNWQFAVGWTGAQRKQGAGTRVVVL